MIGVVGMFSLHFSSIPILWRISQGNFENLPPLDMLLFLFFGLLLMTARYYFAIKDAIAVISNMFGVIANLTMIITIGFFV